MSSDAQVLAAVASPRRREILRLVWRQRADGRRHPSGDARRHLRRGVDAPARAGRGRPGGRARGRPAAALSRQARGAGPDRPDARADVGSRLVASQGTGRVRTDTAWSAPADTTHSRGHHDQPHPSPPARSQRRHRGRARNRVQVLQRQRPLGLVVGQRVDHRAACRRPRVHSASGRRGGLGRGHRGAAAAAHRVHLRLRHRRGEPRRDVAGDHPSRTRGPRGHAPAPVACLCRKRHARRARPGLALPALAVWQPGRLRGVLPAQPRSSTGGLPPGPIPTPPRARPRCRASPPITCDSAIASAWSTAWTTCDRTWPPSTDSCPACGWSATATSATVRARCSPTGSRAAPTARSAGAGPTCSSLAPARGSRTSPDSGTRESQSRCVRLACAGEPESFKDPRILGFQDCLARNCSPAARC